MEAIRPQVLQSHLRVDAMSSILLPHRLQIPVDTLNIFGGIITLRWFNGTNYHVSCPLLLKYFPKLIEFLDMLIRSEFWGLFCVPRIVAKAVDDHDSPHPMNIGGSNCQTIALSESLNISPLRHQDSRKNRGKRFP